MKTRNAVLGILAGVATGALIGILFAPDKGSRTRRKILDKAEDLKEALDDKVEDLADMVHTISEKVESIKDEAKELINKGKMKYDGAREKI